MQTTILIIECSQLLICALYVAHELQRTSQARLHWAVRGPAAGEGVDGQIWKEFFVSELQIAAGIPAYPSSEDYIRIVSTQNCRVQYWISDLFGRFPICLEGFGFI